MSHDIELLIKLIWIALSYARIVTNVFEKQDLQGKGDFLGLS